VSNDKLHSLRRSRTTLKIGLDLFKPFPEYWLTGLTWQSGLLGSSSRSLEKQEPEMSQHLGSFAVRFALIASALVASGVACAQRAALVHEQYGPGRTPY